MFETYAPIFANGVGIVGVLAWLVWMLGTGRLATGRELSDKKAEIAALTATLEIRDRQLDSVLREYLPAANSVMQALHQAGVRHEDAEGEHHQAAGELSEQ